MFQHENDSAARAEIITYRYRPARGDYTTDTRADWCVARLRGLPNQFPVKSFDAVGRQATEVGLGIVGLGD